MVIDPADYDRVIEELKDKGETSLELRKSLARKVFQYTAYYDSLIANYFNKLDSVDYPEIITLSFKDKMDLRYGKIPIKKQPFIGK